MIRKIVCYVFCFFGAKPVTFEEETGRESQGSTSFSSSDGEKADDSDERSAAHR